MKDDVKKQADYLYWLLVKNYKEHIHVTLGISYLYENIHVDFRNDYPLIFSELIHKLLIPTDQYCYYPLNDSHDAFLHDYLSVDKDITHTINTLALEMIDIHKRKAVNPLELFDCIYHKIPRKYSYKEANFIIWGVIQELLIESLSDKV